MYLCPLSVLLIFAIGVLILSVVLPRIQDRRQSGESPWYDRRYAGRRLPTLQEVADGVLPTPADTMYDPDEPLADEEELPEPVSFDPLFDGFVSSEQEETERASATPEELP
jgi:hypothetical protein